MNEYPPVIDINNHVKLEKCHIDDLNEYFGFSKTVKQWNNCFSFEKIAQLEVMIKYIISLTEKFHKSPPYQYFRLTTEEAQKVLMAYSICDGALYKWNDEPYYHNHNSQSENL